MRSEDVRIVLEEPVGDVICHARHRPGSGKAGGILSAETAGLASATRNPKQKSPPRLASRRKTSASTGISRRSSRLGRLSHACRSQSCAALAAAQPRLDLFDDAFAPSEVGACLSLCAADDDASHDFETRMFAPTLGVLEDPATGAAAAAFAGALMAFENVPDGHHALTLEQGVALGRPSKIVLSLDVEDGASYHGVGRRFGGHRRRRDA